MERFEKIQSLNQILQVQDELLSAEQEAKGRGQQRFAGLLPPLPRLY